MSGLAIISILFSFAVGIIILIYYFSNFKGANSFIKYGLIMLLIFTILELFAVGLKALSFLLIVTYIKLIVYVCIGMHLCSRLGYRDLPIIRRLLSEVKSNKVKINAKNYMLQTASVIAGAVIYSCVLFKLTSPSASENLKNIVTNNVSGIFGETSIPKLICSMFIIAISEELVYRFIVPNLIAMQFKLNGNKYWIAITISSMLWALAHAGILNPEWVKLAQIFPIGLAIGGLFRKYGLESCIFAHALFNISMIFLPANFIRI